MGISNLRSGAALALTGADATAAAKVMRWDLVNAWARLYELNSTHPMTALRVRAVNQDATAMNLAVALPAPVHQHPVPQIRSAEGDPRSPPTYPRLPATFPRDSAIDPRDPPAYPCDPATYPRHRSTYP